MKGFAVAFDIDGVLTRSHRPVNGARDAILKLKEWHPPGQPHLKGCIPVVFVTNGGGCTEEEKARRMNKILDVDFISGDQIVLAHTPFKDLVPRLGKECVVGVGPGAYPVMTSYGFNVISMEDYATLHPYLFDHRHYNHAISSPTPTPPVKAIFVMSDGLDWSQELQIMVDLLKSNGTPGEADETQPVELHHANPDFEYSGQFKWPRFTAGAMLECLKALYRRSSGRELKYTEYGKPTSQTYVYAEHMIKHNATDVFDGFEHIYMVGDNPKSDIRGANSRGAPWVSVLVRSGMFKGDNDECDPADLVFSDALEAVDVIIQRETGRFSAESQEDQLDTCVPPHTPPPSSPLVS